MKKHVITIGILCLLVAAIGYVLVLRSELGTPGRAVSRMPEPCAHGDWAEGVCARCGQRCRHKNWAEGICTRCGYACPHPDWTDSRCVRCGEACPHDIYEETSHSCARCGAVLEHRYKGYRCVICGKALEFEDSYIPWELFYGSDRPGRVETLTYETPDYYALAHSAESTETWEKSVSVYLPHGYDPARQYNVLVLVHGMGGTETYWLLGEQEYYGPGTEKVRTLELLDNMIAQGLCREMIVVTPTFYKDSSHRNQYDRQIDQVRFAGELRNEILPLIAETYSTYAADGSEESLIAAREHFAYAGLSMGSIYGYNAVLPESVDLFAWYGMFAGSECNVTAVANALNAPENLRYPLSFLYNCAGTRDSMGPPHLAQYRQLLELCPQLTEGENAAFTDIQGAYHEYRAWGTGLYNFLRILFY